MDQAAGEAMRLAAELVSVGTMALAQQVRVQERREEDTLRRIEQQTREAARARRQPVGQRDRPAAKDAQSVPADETLAVTPDPIAEGADPSTTAPMPAVTDPPSSSLDVDPHAVTAEIPLTPPPVAPPAEPPAPLAAARAAEAVPSPANRAKALVEVGTMPTGAGGLQEAGSRLGTQGRPARSASLGRSPLPGHNLSR
jgi:hypothetical protein